MKFSRIARPISSTGSPRSFATARATSTTKAGSLRWPRWGGGARKGASVSTSSLSRGTVRATSWMTSARGKATMPENEMQKPSTSARSASSRDPVKQWMTPPISSVSSCSRMAAVSVSASRVCTITGSPTSRASRSCRRNTSRCTSRGEWS